MDEMTMAVYELADKYFGEGNYRQSNGQITVKKCPFCNGGDNGDCNTFAIGLHNGAWQCLRGSCRKKGSFKELADHFGMKTDVVNNIPHIIKDTKKEYAKPDATLIRPLTEKCELYFILRGISRATLDDFKVSSDPNGNILFPFYREGILTYVKYRSPKRKLNPGEAKEWQDPNLESILFGMDNVSFNKPVIITEGMIDALSVYEAGEHNVISVPSGCKNLNWIETCWDWLEKCNQFILFGDNDQCGKAMVDQLQKRLGEDKCLLMPEYPFKIIDGEVTEEQCKDANDILMSYGPDVLKQLIEQAKPTPIKGVLNLASVEFVDPMSIPRIMTKIPSLDRAIGGFAEGGVTVLSGKRGEGERFALVKHRELRNLRCMMSRSSC